MGFTTIFREEEEEEEEEAILYFVLAIAFALPLARLTPWMKSDQPLALLFDHMVSNVAYLFAQTSVRDMIFVLMFKGTDLFASTTPRRPWVIIMITVRSRKRG